MWFPARRGDRFCGFPKEAMTVIILNNIFYPEMAAVAFHDINHSIHLPGIQVAHTADAMLTWNFIRNISRQLLEPTLLVYQMIYCECHISHTQRNPPHDLKSLYLKKLWLIEMKINKFLAIVCFSGHLASPVFLDHWLPHQPSFPSFEQPAN